MIDPNEPKGFSYYVTEEQIKEYLQWPVEKRLEWLLAANLLRNALPEEIRKKHEMFRRGEI